MININTHSIKLLSDLTTPVSLFLKLREHFPEILLLESSDYSSKEDSQSFICFEPLLTLKYVNAQYELKNHLNNEIRSLIAKNATTAIQILLDAIEPKNSDNDRFNGVFGYTSFDMVQEFEGLKFDSEKPNYGIPALRYDLFRYIIAFDHFYDELYLIENEVEGQGSTLDKILSIISRQDHQTYPFSKIGEESGNMTDDYYLNIVQKAKSHCQRGDVFQMVLSRRFSQSFKGDEF
ncbi:MAG TPA: anthranilate synthase component I family protein, partial [Saprospiraceae bacterium]|nr:anthranilate synthase component I family protein [Saprospiraceae bacterium]